VGQVLAALAVIAVVVAVIRFVRPRWGLRWSSPDISDGEERDSVFTWRHLAAQLFNGVRALLSRLRRRRSGHEQVAVAPVVGTEESGAETVRHAYGRMLAAARVSGAARGATETTREVEDRLSRGPAAGAAGALARLTAVYEDVRYGEHDTTEPARAHAVDQADVVSSALSQGVARRVD